MTRISRFFHFSFLPSAKPLTFGITDASIILPSLNRGFHLAKHDFRLLSLHPPFPGHLASDSSTPSASFTSSIFHGN